MTKETVSNVEHADRKIESSLSLFKGTFCHSHEIIIIIIVINRSIIVFYYFNTQFCLKFCDIVCLSLFTANIALLSDFKPRALFRLYSWMLLLSSEYQYWLQEVKHAGIDRYRL